MPVKYIYFEKWPFSVFKDTSQVIGNSGNGQIFKYMYIRVKPLLTDHLLKT